MKRFFCAILLTGVFLFVGVPLLFSDDYVDDTYYWAPREAKKQRTIVVDEQPSSWSLGQSQPVQNSKVVFLEDSISRRDTVIHAIIRR